MLAFTLIGGGFFIVPIIIENNLKKRCTETILATISSYNKHYGNRKILYCPVYSFKYYNEEYKVSNNHYSNINLLPIGTEVEIKINPDNPKEFLDGSFNFKVLCFIGIMFLIVALPILIHVLTNYEFIK